MSAQFQDWYDRNINAQSRVQAAEMAWNAAGAALTAERDAARRFGEDAAAKYNELIARGPVLTCAFCGEAYPPGTPATQHDALTAHVMECSKHPLKAERDAARARVGVLEAAINWAMGCNGHFPQREVKQGTYYWRGELAERAEMIYSPGLERYERVPVHLFHSRLPPPAPAPEMTGEVERG